VVLRVIVYRSFFCMYIIKNENIISSTYLNATSRKSQKLIPSKKTQSFLVPAKHKKSPIRKIKLSHKFSATRYLAGTSTAWPTMGDGEEGGLMEKAVDGNGETNSISESVKNGENTKKCAQKCTKRSESDVKGIGSLKSQTLYII